MAQEVPFDCRVPRPSTGSLTPLGPFLPPLRQLQWMASSGHCTNIFSSSSTHMGTGATGRYWVQVRTETDPVLPVALY